MSFATQDFAPDLSAAIEIAPLPDPKSRTLFPLTVKGLSKMYLLKQRKQVYNQLKCFLWFTLIMLDHLASKMPKRVHLKDVGSFVVLVGAK